MADIRSDRNTLATLTGLVEPVEIVVFVAHGCPNCAAGVRVASALAAACPMVSVSVVDAGESSDLASRYNIRSVPTFVVNGELTIVGVLTEKELAERIVRIQGPGAEETIFVSLVKSGRIDDASSQLANGRGFSAFAKLWNESALEGRISLSLAAQNAIDKKESSLDHLVELLLPSLETDNAARRGDTADLLGAIGHRGARAALERLLSDDHTDVAEAAEDALASIDERARATDGEARDG